MLWMSAIIIVIILMILIMIYSLFDEEIASDPLVNISVQQTSNSKKVFFTAIS